MRRRRRAAGRGDGHERHQARDPIRSRRSGRRHRRAGGGPRGRNLAGQSEKRAHPPRLQAGRGALYGDARIATPEQLRQVDHRAVIAWERNMREQQCAASSTIRRRMAALSSLFKHLVRHGSVQQGAGAAVAGCAGGRHRGSGLSPIGRGAPLHARTRPSRRLGVGASLIDKDELRWIHLGLHFKNGVARCRSHRPFRATFRRHGGYRHGRFAAPGRSRRGARQNAASAAKRQPRSCHR